MRTWARRWRGEPFSRKTAVMAERPEGIRLWVPILEGSDRSGVLAVTLPGEDPERIKACEALGLLAGYLLTVNGRVSDHFNLHRRRKAMTLAASLQWDLLPPLVFKSPPVTVAGILEPAYEVGGDCFDYSINWPVLDVALMDSMGHGVNSAILASLALGCYRHDRRHGKSLTAMHQELEATVEAALRRQGSSSPGNWRSSTSRPDCCSGPMPAIPCRCTSGAARSSEISRARRPFRGVWEPARRNPLLRRSPWNQAMRSSSTPTVLLKEGRRSGGGFGLDRLVDVVGQNASDQLAAEEIVRRIGRTVLEYHGERLDDDATLVIMQWHGTS